MRNSRIPPSPLGRPVGNEAVLAVERLCTRVRVGYPQRHRLLRIDDREWLATHDEDWRRALDVQGALWRSGQVRAVGFPGLLVTAVAERERVAVLRYDAGYDLIAHVTGQPMQLVVPRATVP